MLGSLSLLSYIERDSSMKSTLLIFLYLSTAILSIWREVSLIYGLKLCLFSFSCLTLKSFKDVIAMGFLLVLNERKLLVRLLSYVKISSTFKPQMASKFSSGKSAMLCISNKYSAVSYFL